MRTINIHSLSIAAVAALALAGPAVAQDKSSDVLNSVEVQQLVARAQPADHQRLAAHFNALADRSDTEAKRHTAMSRAFGGNPSRNLGTGMSAHCTRLARVNTDAASTLREVGAFHHKQAGGGPVTAPSAAARLNTGTGAPAPTDQELETLAAKASTPSDHRILREYFLALQKRYETTAADHAALVRAYRGTRMNDAAVHHDRMARMSREAATEAGEAAKMHDVPSGAAR